MAFYQGVADRRWSNLGNSLGTGLTAGFNQQLNAQLQQDIKNQDLQTMYDLNKKLYEDKAKLDLMNKQIQTQNALDQKKSFLDQVFGSNAQVPIAEGQPQIPIEGMMNPTNTGLSQQVLNRLKMEGLTGVKIPTAKTTSMSEFGKWARDTNVPPTIENYKQYIQIKSQGKNRKTTTPTNLSKLLQEMQKYPVDSPQYRAYLEKIKLETQGRDNPLETIMLQQMLGDQGGIKPNPNPYNFPLPQGQQSAQQKQPSVLDLYK